MTGLIFLKKDYCKLFFVWENEDKTRAVYQQEGLRYLLPNLYNSNDFNRKQDGKILGLPNNNMGMNSKKTISASLFQKSNSTVSFGSG